MVGMPSRIWIRACHRPDANLSPEQSIERIGGNQGNLLYQFSVFRALAAEDVTMKTVSYRRFDKGTVDERAAWFNANCEHLVLPLSSSFRLQKTRSLGLWADLVEKLTIPVTIVGVGAQLRLDAVETGSFTPARVSGATASAEEIEAHDSAVRRFVAAILDRSESIGVRGATTKSYLEHLGFPADRVDAIGCPSVFTWGPGYRMPTDIPQLTPASRLSLSFDHRIRATAEILDKTISEYPNSEVYAQERIGIRMLVTGEETRADWPGDDRFPVKTSHPIYGQHRLVYTPTAWSWIEYLKSVDFAFGPRLHGTLAAVLAGTPGHLLVHDSRGLEIAQHHDLPFTLVDELEGVTAADLAARSDYTAFNASYDEGYETFRAFLIRNGLPVSYDEDGVGLARFDESLEKPRRAALLRSASVQPQSRKPLARRIRRLARRALKGLRR